MIEELRLAELLCTRLCHDLTGPIGAVNNGAEFLSEEGFNMQNQAMELIVSSAFSAVTRLQFYRFAYGKVRDQGEASLSEKQKLAADFFAGGKISLDWPDSHTDSAGVSVSQKMSRLVFNLLIVGSDALIRGGTIGVRFGQDMVSGKQISIAVRGPGIKWDAEMEKGLRGELSVAELNAKNVQFYLTSRFVKDLGADLTCELEGDELTLALEQRQA